MYTCQASNFTLHRFFSNRCRESLGVRAGSTFGLAKCVHLVAPEGQMRTVYTYLLMLFAVLGAVGSAYALPQTFVQEGLVTNRVGQPMQGAHRVEIQLFNAVAGGNRLY